MAFNFVSLIAPISADRFLAEYWENKPLFLKRGSESFYGHLLCQKDVEHIVSSTDLRHPAMRLAKHGSYLPPRTYTTSFNYGDDAFTGIPDIGIVSAEYRSGATVVLPALDRNWEPLQLLRADLEDRFDHVAHMNAYITPGNAVGFSPHYDTHEVFILQIAGKKHWRVCEPPLRLPHESQPFIPAGYTPTEPILDIELTAGDLLYLPRGYIHAAMTSDVHSIHITIGISIYTWVELLLELVSASKQSEVFRKGLPPGFASREDVKSIVKSTLPELIDQLGKLSDVDVIMESFTRRLKAKRVATRPAFHADERVIGLDSNLKVLDTKYQVSQENGSIEVEFDGKRILLPGYVKEVLNSICTLGSFTVRDLPANLDDETKLVLLRHLQLEGFVVAG